MSLTAVRYIALYVIVVASVGSLFASSFGQAVLFGFVALALFWLGRSSDAEQTDFKLDLIRITLVWKALGKGNVTATVLSWCTALFIFLVQVSQGKLLLDPLRAFLFFALNGFCAGTAYYLLFRWPADLRHLDHCNETQLLIAAARERKIVREFNPVTLPYRFMCGYEL